MADARVTCIVKPDRYSSHEHISHLGGVGWMWPVEDVIRSIKDGSNTFFTDVGGRRADIKVRTNGHREFVQTVSDGYWGNNLLDLNACPL